VIERLRKPPHVQRTNKRVNAEASTRFSKVWSLSWLVLSWLVEKRYRSGTVDFRYIRDSHAQVRNDSIVLEVVQAIDHDGLLRPEVLNDEAFECV